MPLTHLTGSQCLESRRNFQNSLTRLFQMKKWIKDIKDSKEKKLK